MIDFLSFVFDAVFDMVLSDYFVFALGVVIVLGVFSLVYRLAGKS